MTNMYNSGIDLLEEKGYMASTEYYSALQKITSQNIQVMNSELKSLEEKFSEAMSSGEIEEYSEAWYSMQESINDVKESIADANVELAEYAKTIRETKWERFDYVQDRISQITQETEFLVDLMSDLDFYDDKGQLNNNGLATMGLYAESYNIYMSQANQYAKELLEINKEIAKDPYNTDLISRREELLGLQQDSIQAAEDEKQSIVDLVSDGIQVELDALKDLIDTYEESLDSAKSLYDYQDKVSEKSQEIASLQKQLAAYSGDNSEETRATVQKLQSDLSEAQKDLTEIEYEQFISDQKELLDELYTEYEEVLNQRLDNVDALISDMIDVVNANSDTINATLSNIANDVGYTLTPQIQAIWDGSTGTIDGVIAKYGDKFSEQNTAVKLVLDSISANVASMVTTSDESAKETISETTPSTTPTTPPTASISSQPIIPSETSKPKLDEATKKKVAAAIWRGTLGWGSNPDRAKKLTEVFGANNGIQALVNQGVGMKDGGKDVAEYSYAVMRKKFKGYKTGGLVDYTGLAQVDGTPGKPELMLNAEDTENFIGLRNILREMSSQAITLSGSNAFGSIPTLNGVSDVSNMLAAMSVSNGSIGTTFGDFEINIPIEKVEDYNDFVRQLQKDSKFEKMIASMTVGRLSGDSALEKHRYKW